MINHQTLREALKTQRTDNNEHLLSETDVLNVIRSVPVQDVELQNQHSSPIHRTRSSLATPIRWAAGLAVCSVLAFIGYQAVTDDSYKGASGETHESPSDAANSDGIEPTSGRSANDEAEQATDNRNSHNTDGLPATTSNNDTKTTYLIPSTETLSNLGLALSQDKLTYTEGTSGITIKTSGISARMKSISENSITPRHITMYRKGKPFASWHYPKESVPNDLVPLRFTLKDESNTVFPEAEVVLWYVPTDDFLSALSASQRASLRSELAGNHTADGLLENRTTTRAISESKLYPNPVHGNSTTIEFSATYPLLTTATIVDLQGQVVLSAWTAVHNNTGINTQQIHGLEALPNGMYLLVIQNEGTQEQIIQRLLIER